MKDANGGITFLGTLIAEQTVKCRALLKYLVLLDRHTITFGHYCTVIHLVLQLWMCSAQKWFSLLILWHFSKKSSTFFMLKFADLEKMVQTNPFSAPVQLFEFLNVFEVNFCTFTLICSSLRFLFCKYFRCFTFIS